MRVLKTAAALMGVALLALAAPAAAQSWGPAASGPAFVISAGPDFGAGSSRAWRESFATFEYRSDRAIWRGVRPLYSFSVARHGAVLGTVGVHGVFQLGRVEVTPHFGVGLYQDGRGSFDRRELLQFRSGIDAFLPVTDRVSVGIGYYHVSNARITNRSADLDVIRLSILWRN